MKRGEYWINSVYTHYKIYEEMDRTVFRAIYADWIKLNSNLTGFGEEAIGLPKLVYEGLYSIECGAVRITDKDSKVQFYDFRKQATIKVVAVHNYSGANSVKLNTGEFDELHIMDFYGTHGLDGTYDVYIIPKEIIPAKNKCIDVCSDILFKYKLNPVATLRI